MMPTHPPSDMEVFPNQCVHLSTMLCVTAYLTGKLAFLPVYQ